MENKMTQGKNSNASALLNFLQNSEEKQKLDDNKNGSSNFDNKTMVSSTCSTNTRMTNFNLTFLYGKVDSLISSLPAENEEEKSSKEPKSISKTKKTKSKKDKYKKMLSTTISKKSKKGKGEERKKSKDATMDPCPLNDNSQKFQLRERMDGDDSALPIIHTSDVDELSLSDSSSTLEDYECTEVEDGDSAYSSGISCDSDSDADDDDMWRIT